MKPVAHVQKFPIIKFLLFCCAALLSSYAAGEENKLSHPNNNLETAIFAGGCFWSMESDFEQAPGVMAVISGYTGGRGETPTYDDYRVQGHVEAIQVSFDPSVIQFKQLLEYYWMSIDPTDAAGQFCDRGHEYASTIFYQDDAQKKQAEASKSRLDQSKILDEKVVTLIRKAAKFFPAEEQHQDYYRNNPLAYKSYRHRCQRDSRLDELWGDGSSLARISDGSSQYRKPGEEELKQQLTLLQYRVTQQDLTEPPFRNEYWNNNSAGIYVDVVSGEPLFSSLDKFKSGTGWPSFTRPLETGNILSREGETWYDSRTEIRSKYADSHLGHVFDDGPAPTGLRYCINSASLRFIAKEDLVEKGYARYLELFK